MESITMANHEDHLTNSVQEVDTQEPDLGPVARSYECMFCRRGFTTAQALGGHMNIHRKDRAKGSRPSYLSNNNSNKQEDHSSYANPIFHHQVYTSYPQTHISKTRINQEGNARYTTCFSSISSAAQLVDHGNNDQDCCGVIKSPSRDEKMMTLSLESCGWSYGEGDRASTTRDRPGSDDDELDLELRLGHEPFKLQNSDGRPLFSSSQNVFLG